ncbi:MAG: hypothetical protein WC389_16785 [Lutibacter sp.]|jgi:sulfur relay (sulfurtransferase) DsrC/TusE family protein
MSKVEDFKIAHKRFSEALAYMVSNETELRSTPEKWEKVKRNFYKKFETPLDLAWAALDPEDQKSLSSLYLFRKAAEDQQVKKVMKTFDAKITEVEPVVLELDKPPQI